MIGFSSVSKFDVLLPVGNENTSILNLIIYIRDTLDCVTEYYNISSVFVKLNSSIISNLMNSFQNSSSNPVVELLSNGNQNTVGQVISSLSQQFNKINNESVKNAISSKY